MQRIEDMIFSQVLARFRPHSSEQGHIKDKPQQPLLEASENLNSTNELNQALKAIDQAVQNKTATNQQRLLKAEILLRKEKFHKAKAVLTELSETREDRNIRKKSNHLLDKLPQLQQRANERKSRALVSDLIKIAEKYQTKLSSLPEPEELTPDCDITLLIRKESRLARSSELPCLSYELIERTLNSGLESPWLIHDKALSLNLMGRQTHALKLLKELKATTKKEKLSQSIERNIEAIQKPPKDYRLKLKLFLAKQASIVAERNDVSACFIPESSKIDNEIRVRLIILAKAREIPEENPKASLDFADSVLDFYQGDLAALMLKSEALYALRKTAKAMEIWTKLARSDNKKIAEKASELVSQHLSYKARTISQKSSPEKAITFFIEEHVKLKLVPRLNKGVNKILRQLNAFDGTFQDPELERHQLQLLLNTQLIECLEAQLREQGRLGGTPTAQIPVAIRKTAPKAG